MLYPVTSSWCLAKELIGTYERERGFDVGQKKRIVFLGGIKLLGFSTHTHTFAFEDSFEDMKNAARSQFVRTVSDYTSGVYHLEQTS